MPNVIIIINVIVVMNICNNTLIDEERQKERQHIYIMITSNENIKDILNTYRMLNQ